METNKLVCERVGGEQLEARADQTIARVYDGWQYVLPTTHTLHTLVLPSSPQNRGGILFTYPPHCGVALSPHSTKPQEMGAPSRTNIPYLQKNCMTLKHVPFSPHPPSASNHPPPQAKLGRNPTFGGPEAWSKTLKDWGMARRSKVEIKLLPSL
jgi:hypothetical protein